MATRIPALDLSKGAVSLLVVFVHTAGGFITTWNLTPNYLYKLVVQLNIGFNVQTYFIIAGFLSFQKASDLRFQAKRCANLYYAYLFWSLVTFFLAFSDAAGANHKMNLVDLAMIPVLPIQHFWFLLALLVHTLSLFVLRNSVALLAASVAMSAMAIVQSDWINIGYFFPFMAVGALLRLGDVVPKASNAAGAAAAALAVVGAALAVHYEVSMRSPVFYIFSIAACYALYVGAVSLNGAPIGRMLAYVGQKSMPIYLAHVIFAAAARTIILKYVHVLDNGIGVVVACIVGVVGPVVLFEASDRLGVSRWLGFAPLLSERQVRILA